MKEKHCKWYNDEFCINDQSPCVADYCPVVEYPELCKCRELDKDINVRSKDDTDIDDGMFDEVVIDALKALAVNHSNDSYLYKVFVNAIRLINRLQAENKEWETLFDISNKRNYRKKFNEEWKKEYQKELDKQGEGVIAGFPDFDLVYKLYFEQKAEIERLNIAVEGLTAENKVVHKENDELIKKVEGQRKIIEYQDGLEERLSDKQRALWDLQDDFDNLLDEGKQQAVKDTAKEIFEAIFNECWVIKDEIGQRVFIESVIKHIAKERFGVEVE